MNPTDFSVETRSLLSHLLNLPLRDRLSVIENILNNACVFEPNGNIRHSKMKEKAQEPHKETPMERIGFAQPGKIYRLKNGELPTPDIDE